MQCLIRGGAGLSEAANRATHVAIGHPEGYIEAFANLYQDLADVIIARKTNQEVDPLARWFPTVEDGLHGVKFVETSIKSNKGSTWELL